MKNRGGESVSRQPDEAKFGLTAERLDEEFSRLGGGSALVEPFMVGEQSPAEGLTDRQIEIFVPRLQKAVNRMKEERAASGEPTLGI